MNRSLPRWSVSTMPTASAPLTRVACSHSVDQEVDEVEVVDQRVGHVDEEV